MDAKLHRRIQRYGWDIAVEDYDKHWVPVLTSCSERCLAMVAPKAGERVLDVATGTGVAAFLAANAVGETGEVVATDISENMIEAVRRAAGRRGVANMTCARADAEELPYEDASFDAALCVLGLMYPADPQNAIEQMCRVLKPGGRVAVCVWGRRDRCGWNEVFPIVDARVHSDVCPMFFSLGALGALEFAFERAGFRDLREERVAHELAWRSDEEACAAMFAGGPVALAYSRFDKETRAAVHSEYIASLEPYRRGNGFAVEGEFVFMSATKA